MTDNHWSCRRSADVAAVIATLGAKHRVIKPHGPWQHAKVERFNRQLTPAAQYEIMTPSKGGQSMPWRLLPDLQLPRQTHSSDGQS
jgi:transposase InsO family protein